MTATPSTLLFVDSTVSDYESLLQGLGGDTQVVVLNADLDGLGQITDTLANYNNLQSVQILSHGGSGRLQLGSSLVTTASLTAESDRLQSWSRALSANADILLLGCDVAAGETGTHFIQTLADLTGADVAASTNTTGSSGDWILEAFTGSIETSLTLQKAATDSYQSNLRSNLLFQESFTGTNVTSGPWIFGRLQGATSDLNPFLTARGTTSSTPGGLPGSSTGIAIDSPGQGALRLTGLNQNQSTFVLYDQSLSSSAGIDVTFDFFSYGGGLEGADGIAFYLIDGNANPQTAGGFGGALGYSARLNNPNSNGLVGGYLGIGFDEFGNFANQFNGDGSTVQILNGGVNTTIGQQVPDSVTVRGPGSGRTGYAYITHQALPGGASIDESGVSSRAQAQRTAQIILGTDRSLTIFVDPDGRNNPLAPVQVLRIADVTLAAGQAIPERFKFGFGGATGSSINIHEIRNLEIRTTAFPPVALDRAIDLPVGETVIPLTGDNALAADDTDPNEADRGIINFVITRLPTQGSLVRGNGTPITSLPAGGAILGLTAAANLLYVPNNPNNPTDDSFEYTATDRSGARDATPAIVSFIAPPNVPPTANDLSFEATPGETVQVPVLSGNDTDGTIEFFTITRIPLETQGTLKVGSTSGAIVQIGDRLTPTQVSQLFFAATPGFTEATFQYTARDNRGAFSTPATVTIAVPEGVCVAGLTATITNIAGGTLLGTANIDVLTGSPGDDFITGSTCSDTITGLGGNDTLRGGRQSDNISGGSGSDTIQGGGGFDLLSGDNGSDVIDGEVGNDTISGGFGNDRLQGNAGDDVIQGEDGNDFAQGGLGIDSISGGAGNDTLQGDEGNDTLSGGVGDDSLSGFEDNDALFGGNGIDTLDGGAGDDTLGGGLDNDLLIGNAGDDSISGEGGNDRLSGDVGNDTLNGGEGDDTLLGRIGQDVLNGDAGNDVLRSGQGNDIARAGDGNDAIFGRAGDDALFGDAGDDVITAEGGQDQLTGGLGSDTLFGGSGRDTMFGGQDNDFLYAEAGADFLFGSLGNDTLRGGINGDELTGGEGADIFLYSANDLAGLAAESTLAILDQITDFTPTDGDRLSFQLNGAPFAPTRLANAGVIQAANLDEAMATAFVDKNQELPGAQPLKLGQATFFTWDDGIYLTANVGGPDGFDLNQDFLINVTGFVFSTADATAGILNTANYFVTSTTT